MILFLDSSALVKLYLEEAETALVIEAVQNAKAVVVSTLALPEVVSVFGRYVEEGALRQTKARQIFADLLLDWENLERYPLENHVAKEAGSLSLSRALRGADAVQLATAAVVARERRNVRMLAFDQKLNAAAQGIVRLYQD